LGGPPQRVRLLRGLPGLMLVSLWEAPKGLASLALADALSTAASLALASARARFWRQWTRGPSGVLDEAGLDCPRMLLPGGERAKGLEQVSRVWRWLASHGATGRTALVAVGGGLCWAPPASRPRPA